MGRRGAHHRHGCKLSQFCKTSPHQLRCRIVVKVTSLNIVICHGATGLWLVTREINKSSPRVFHKKIKSGLHVCPTHNKIRTPCMSHQQQNLDSTCVPQNNKIRTSCVSHTTTNSGLHVCLTKQQNPDSCVSHKDNFTISTKLRTSQHGRVWRGQGKKHSVSQKKCSVNEHHHFRCPSLGMPTLWCADLSTAHDGNIHWNSVVFRLGLHIKSEDTKHAVLRSA